MPRLMPKMESSKEGRGAARGAVLSDKGSPIMENAQRPVPVQRLAAQGAPWGPRSPSALQSPPLSPPWGQPRLLPGRGWEKMAQTFEEGNKSPHSSLWKEMPSSGEGGQRTVWREARAPCLAASPSTHLRAAQHPRPSPSPPGSSPGAEVRGRPPLVVCLEGREGRRGEKPKVGLAEGLTGNSTTLA